MAASSSSAPDSRAHARGGRGRAGGRGRGGASEGAGRGRGDPDDVPDGVKLRRVAYTAWATRPEDLTSWTDDDEIALLNGWFTMTADLDEVIRFHISQIEYGTQPDEQTGRVRPHRQGYMEFWDPTTRIGVKKYFNGDFARTVSVRYAKKVAEANITYCTKLKNKDKETGKETTTARVPGTEVYRYGTPARATPGSKRARGEGDAVVDDDDDAAPEHDDAPKEKKPKVKPHDDITHLLWEGKKIRDIWLEPAYAYLRPTIVMNRRVYNETEAIVAMQSAEERDGLFVEVVYGAPGVGKSHLVKARWGAAAKHLVFRYTCAMEKWWDGLTPEHRVVLIDDFDGWIAPAVMIQVLDKYDIRLNQKYGSILAPYLHILLCSNVHPDFWWGWKENRDARKFNEEQEARYRERVAEAERNNCMPPAPPVPIPVPPCDCKDWQMASIRSRITEIKEFRGMDQRKNFRSKPFPPTNPDYCEREMNLDLVHACEFGKEDSPPPLPSA